MKKMMFAAAAAVLCAAPAAAQSPDAVPIVRRNLITANPIGILADYYNVEFERALSDVSSLSLAGERSTVDDTDLTAVDVRFRYYPQARMFSGLALGGSLGYARYMEEDDYFVDTPSGPIYEDRDVERSSPTIGLQVDYSWLLGRDGRLYVGLGFGLRRLLNAGDDNDNNPTLIPGGRYLGIGYTF
jgi:opacity protein-like surface antigen